MKVLLLVSSVLTLSACAQMQQRSAGSGYDAGPQYHDSVPRARYDRETNKTAYELGKDPSTLTAEDLSQIKARQKVRDLERTLSSKKEREQYSKVLPWLRSDDEKIAFLSIPSVEGRQQWINRENIWARSQAPAEEMKSLIDSQDIAVGMPADYVRRSWGEPQAIEVSGNPIYKNERWKYQRQVSTAQGYRQETRHVYFESGRVVGWETE
jgi:hypothetical protein